MDADFSGNKFPDEATDDSDTACYCSEFIVSYLGCPDKCKSQLQVKLSLISTDSEYIARSQALCKTIPIIELLK